MNTISGENKLIFKNTIIIYIRMLIVTVVGLISARFVLQALGVSDYGLYNIVAGLISMLNFISAAMSTTTRRFINIEMGKTNGNLNKIFNVSLLLHIFFALFIFIIAETIGLWYINNMLNVESNKFADAKFIFHISTIVACIGIINVPFQSLIEAFEKFSYTAVIDIIAIFLKLGFIMLILYYPGNSLRVYAILMCLVSLVSFVLYSCVCMKNWSDIISFKLYKNCPLYKEIIIFNNYTALGAAACIGKSQGGNLLVNYFFGTIVNGAFAMAFQIDNYVYMFVNKLTMASNPQMAKNFSKGTLERSNSILEKNSKYSILIMSVFYFSLIVDLEYILGLWLGKIPPGTAFLCFLTLTDALVRSFSEGTNGYVQASGKVKWFQIVSSVFMFINLPTAYILFSQGFDAYWILICYISFDIIVIIVSLFMMKRILSFDVLEYIRNAYLSPIRCIIVLTVIVYLLRLLPINSMIQHILLIAFVGLLSTGCVFFIGLDKREQAVICNFFKFKMDLK
ncbi:MAG: hypothetical protein J6A27_07455 [Bacteroidales bacterium]|nr:hypothetical protein [Bacteroidales bacterium]